MIAKYKTKLDANSFNALNKITFKKMSIFFILFSLFFIAGGILIIANESDLSSGIFCVIVGLLFYPFVKLIVKISTNKINKTMPIAGDQTYSEFIFNSDNYSIIQTKGSDYTATTQSSYDYLYKIIETKDHFFLYVSAQQCHVIPKDSLIEGNSTVLSKLFISKLGNKYLFK